MKVAVGLVVLVGFGVLVGVGVCVGVGVSVGKDVFVGIAVGGIVLARGVAAGPQAVNARSSSDVNIINNKVELLMLNSPFLYWNSD